MQTHRQLAYALFRALLGIDICLHGVTRLTAGESAFAGKIVSQFAHTILPHGLVLAYALTLPWAEAIIGLLILLGLRTQEALAAGFLVMLSLMFGTSLMQDWQIAGLQLIYGISYAGLLFLLPYNGFSVDSLLDRRRSQHCVDR